MASEIEQDILERLRRLPPAKQQQVLDFVEFLERKGKTSLAGIFADAGVSISAEEIDAARAEAWGNFPRQDV